MLPGAPGNVACQATTVPAASKLQQHQRLHNAHLLYLLPVCTMHLFTAEGSAQDIPALLQAYCCNVSTGAFRSHCLLLCTIRTLCQKYACAPVVFPAELPSAIGSLGRSLRKLNVSGRLQAWTCAKVITVRGFHLVSSLSCASNLLALATAVIPLLTSSAKHRSGSASKREHHSIVASASRYIETQPRLAEATRHDQEASLAVRATPPSTPADHALLLILFLTCIITCRQQPELPA